MPIKFGGGPVVCRWINAHDALEHFATYTGSTQSQQHIKPLHWYVACRLVLEGGFLPEEIKPRPPFTWKKKKKGEVGEQLIYDPSVATGQEETVLGGLKTKNVDVVVSKPSVGPVMAISLKGTFGAFRNLTNRMEEAVGDCTNLHITYPAMVSGFISILRANHPEDKAAVKELSEEEMPKTDASPARTLKKNDIAIREGGEPVEVIFRYHSALRELTGRQGIRDDLSRYETVAMALIATNNTTTPGTILDSFPPSDSPLRFEQFFQSAYLRYDERFVYAAPDIKRITRRREWSPTSPVFVDPQNALLLKSLDYTPRFAE